MIKKVTIYGERCSGTNYLETLLSLNFNVTITWEYGWKHFFGFSDLSNSDDTLFICITRNPIDWLNSMYITPHHMQYKNNYCVDTFMNSEVISYDNKKKREITEDHHIEEKRRYHNIIEMRNIKMKYMIDTLPTLVKNYILIRYEDLINDFSNCINNIHNMGLELLNSTPLNSTKYKKTDLPFDNMKKKPVNITKMLLYSHPYFNPHYEIKLKYFDENIYVRFNYYTNKLLDNIKEKIIIPQSANIHKQDGLFFYRGPAKHNNKLTPTRNDMNKGWWWGHNEGFPLDIPCLTISADGVDNNNLPTLMKVRLINNNINAIIVPLSYKRHWIPMFNVIKTRIDWDKKINDVIYRGTLTGRTTQRLDFCKLFYNKYDVGLLKNNGQFKEIDYNRYLKNHMNVGDMIKYKYIISIEGNDKDSGLNWKLASNSVILMPPPIYESWLMEGRLQPYVHYVPLKPDFSDFEEILQWCKKNDNECKKIAENAFNFVSQFTNSETEHLIFDMIKNKYKNKYIFM